MAKNTVNNKTGYWWVKIPYGFYRGHEIEHIRTLKNGNLKVHIFVEMIVESIKYNGHMRFSDEVPYTPELLAAVVHSEPEIIKEALIEFEKVKLVHILEDETIFIPMVEKMSGFKSDEAIKKEKQRKKNKEKGQVSDDEGQMSENVLQSKSKNKNKNNSLEVNNNKLEQTILLYSQFLESFLIEYGVVIDNEAKEKMIFSFEKNIDEDAPNKTIEKYIETAVRNEKSKQIANEVFEQCRDAIKEHYQVISSRFATKEAKLKIASALKNKADPQEIVLGYQNYLKSNKGTDIKYIKNFVVFMNQELWKDFIDWKENNSEQFGEKINVGVDL